MQPTILEMFQSQRDLIARAEISFATARDNLDSAKHNLDNIAAVLGFIPPPDPYYTEQASPDVIG